MSLRAVALISRNPRLMPYFVTRLGDEANKNGDRPDACSGSVLELDFASAPCSERLSVSTYLESTNWQYLAAMKEVEVRVRALAQAPVFAARH